MRRLHPSVVCVSVALLVLVFVAPAPALAYGGPGSVVSGIGTFLAAVAAVAAAVLGFIWFPLKRLYRRVIRRDRTDGEEGGGAA